MTDEYVETILQHNWQMLQNGYTDTRKLGRLDRCEKVVNIDKNLTSQLNCGQRHF